MERIEEMEQIILQPSQSHTGSVIWLHGLGATANDFEPLAKQLQSYSFNDIKFILPQAPVIPITINGGMPMPGWYDIVSFDRSAEQDNDGILSSSKALNTLIEREINSGIAAERIVLAGFSQGGVMVLYTGLSYAQPLGGILAMSSYLPLADTFEEWSQPLNQSMPIQMVHGTHDEVLDHELGQMSYDHLSKLGYQVDFQSYPMGHEVCQEEVILIHQWLEKRFN